MKVNVLRKLDYSIYSDIERAKYVTSLITDSNLLIDCTTDLDENVSLTKQLEGLANYILYGKNPTKSMNLVQQKKINIQSKYSSFKRRGDDSLEELMEHPSFDEGEVRSYNERNSYTKPKQCIHRAKYDPITLQVTDIGDGDIPGMQELWESIDTLEHKLLLYQGKEQPEEGEEIPKWDSYQEFKIKHWIIDLKKHQYYLKDAYHPPIPPHHSFPQPAVIDWESDSKYITKLPFSQIKNNKNYELFDKDKMPQDDRQLVDCWKIIRKHTIDLENPLHLYHLFENYDSLKKSSWDDLNGQMKYILFALEEIGERADLSDIYTDILDLKVIKWSNERIRQFIQEKYGITYNANYISTIYKKNICEKIARTATIMRKEWEQRNNPDAWKICSCCHKVYLKDPYYFIRKSVSKDQLTARCKICDKRIRMEGKIIGDVSKEMQAMQPRTAI